MNNFLRNSKGKFAEFREVDGDLLLYRVVPRMALELLRKYFRLELVGVENIPRRGPAIIVPNHSGYAGFDAVILTHEISRATKRVPRVLTHAFWFLSKFTAIAAQKVGFIQASTENGRYQLKKNNLVILFPEGEYGNFKATSQRYLLREFKRGFIRLALERQCPIVPTLIIGAEETHINLRQIKLPRFLKNAIIPLPLNIIPLPAKWKIIFLEPIQFPYTAEAANDPELVLELAQVVRSKMQKALSKEIGKRGSVYF